MDVRQSDGQDAGWRTGCLRRGEISAFGAFQWETRVKCYCTHDTVNSSEIAIDEFLSSWDEREFENCRNERGRGSERVKEVFSVRFGGKDFSFLFFFSLSLSFFL